MAGTRAPSYDLSVTGSCTSCDSPTEGDEALCPSCLASPDERAAYERVARALGARAEATGYLRAARGALAMARVYAAESGALDPRVLECLDEVRACRAAVRELRAQGRSAAIAEGPGLRKAGTPPSGDAAKRPCAAR